MVCVVKTRITLTDRLNELLEEADKRSEQEGGTYRPQKEVSTEFSDSMSSLLEAQLTPKVPSRKPWFSRFFRRKKGGISDESTVQP